MNQYDEFVQQQGDAYRAFVKVWAMKNPPPKLGKAAGVSGWTMGALVVLVGASLIVSASRTVPEFGGGLVGGAAFVMLEVAMIAYAYWRAKSRPVEHKPLLPFSLPTIGMALAFLIILTANVHQTLRTSGRGFGAEFDMILLIGIGLSAPALALIAGDMLGSEVVRAEARRAQKVAEHGEAVESYRDELNRAWERNKRSYGIRTDMLNPPTAADGTAELAAEIPSVRNEADGTTDGRTSADASGRTTDAREIVRKHYADNPADLQGVRGKAAMLALAERLGVGKTILYEERAELMRAG